MVQLNFVDSQRVTDIAQKKLYFFANPTPLLELRPTAIVKVAAGRVLSISQGKIRIGNYLSQKKYETLIPMSDYSCYNKEACNPHNESIYSSTI